MQINLDKFLISTFQSGSDLLYYIILLSILLVRDRKDNTEGPKPVRVLSQTHREPNQQMGLLVSPINYILFYYFEN